MSEWDNDFEVEEQSGGGRSIVNLLTLVVLALSVLAVGCFVTILLVPDIVPDVFPSGETELLNTAAPPPTWPPSLTPESYVGIPPTWTPTPHAGPPDTPTPRFTPSHTPSPSLTPTFNPTNTPTNTPTPTPSPTETPTPGPSPTPPPTRSNYPFTFDAYSPMYTANYANNAGCNWLGVAGQVFDLGGNPVPAGEYFVWVTESGINQQAWTGSALAYGPSGWEVYIFNLPRVATHRIQLFSPSGTPVSEVYEFTTRASCNQNLTLINFVQNH